MPQEMFEESLKVIDGDNDLLMEDDSVRHGYTSSGLANARTLQTGFPFIELSNLNITPELIRSIPEDTVRRHRVIPICTEGGVVTIALSDPTNSAALDDIRFFVGQNVKIVVVEKDSIEAFIRKYYSDGIDTVTKGLEKKSPISRESGLTYNDDVIVELVNTIISVAISLNASDIHIEPLEARLRIRYRIDGFCYEVNSFPSELQSPITSRIKVMAGMDLAEKRLPQDGRIVTRISGKDIDIRVSTLSVVYGESIVFRILDKTNIGKGLRTLGLFEEDCNLLNSIITVPDGMVIISGPTGSGKTTTLYAVLHELIRPSVNIITIEDPVEYTLDRVNQIQVRAEHGCNFDRILKHILRHDPDIIMVGEMRDLESVEIAMRSAITGHKVLSTLHTNDAPSVITRFLNMGLPPFMVNASVQAVIYQRLVRVLCQKCKIPSRPGKAKILSWMKRDVTEKELKKHLNFGEDVTLFGPVGCKECSFSGYKGRTALFEIMVLDDEIKKLTMKRAPSSVIRKVALEHGMRDIRLDGIMKVIKGMTSINEVLRVT